MEAVKLFERKDVPVNWEYDGEADVLYISFGPPKPAVGVDVGEGVIVRYDEQAHEVVGLTIVGVGRRLEEHIRKEA
ncbi:MAG: DUF2283 domain-containing protein [Nitrospirae bacterium]|nr:MAG: DUF2283 domain-containing protein [Nitrospirota bacterium]